ncbi:Na+/H+ antiporter NhaC family protein [Paraferrimonas sp. SM1919]|uniref:Na+/H+ antiporter NhaC family protein n=1 Tax=Paraferrimonas sp. SM1919 TaxID=2662263 RepID=UPI0013D773D7|nr:Na+/H+ antiporter NhaC family protein [Paraferrimonas sp. SM1919]
MFENSLWALLPTLVVLAVAIKSHRPVFSLMCGSLIAVAMLAPADPLTHLYDITLAVMANDTIGWLIVTVGLFGSLIALLVSSGSALAFSNALAARVKTRQGSLLMTWLLGIIIFIDDYLNALTVSSSMRKVTDQKGVSRQMLAYVVDATSAPICVLIPLSTWAIYYAGLLEENGAAAAGEGMMAYINAIPYMLYPIIALILVPLVAMGIAPLMGKMKQAEADPQAFGELDEDGEEAVVHNDKASIWHFALPLAVLIGVTIATGVNVTIGVATAIVVTLAFYQFSGLMKFGEALDHIGEGLKGMVIPLAIVTSSFILKEANDQLKMTEYVIAVAEPVMSGAWIPALSFIIVALLAFATGSFWGVFAVAAPIILPLAMAADANMPLVIGAMVSACAAGSHACFYGDSTVLSAKGSGCTVMSHALTQLPYVLLVSAISIVGYLVLGML